MWGAFEALNGGNFLKACKISFGLLVLTYNLFCSGVFALDVVVNSTPADTFDYEMYNEMLSQEVNSLGDIVENFSNQQFTYLRLTPPDPLMFLTQGAGMLPFNPKGFPDSFVMGLIPSDNGGVTVYPLVVAEDPTTGQKDFYNSLGQVIVVVAPGAGYNKNWIALDINPNLYNSGLSGDYINELIQGYNPARVVIRYDLILEDDLKKYVSNLSNANAQAAMQSAAMQSGGMSPMMAYNGPAVTNLCFTSIEYKTNGTVVTIAYPFNLATYPTDCFTNKLELFVCSNLLDFYCTSKGVTNVSSTTNWIEWVDSEALGTNIPIRFYFAGNADIDSDGDGLTDAEELYLCHSCATNADTDGDGLSDYYEYMVSHTDPCNPATNIPVASITFPTNNYSWVWMP